MGKITDISVQKRNRSRVNVFVDGQFVCGMDAVSAVASRLHIGDEVSAEQLIAAVKEGEISSAFERATDYLSRSPRSSAEIARYLTEKGYAAETVKAAVEKLLAYRYLDDREYAAGYIRSRQKKYGEFRIRSELKQKGIPAELIEELLDGDGENIDDIAAKYLRSHKADKQKLKRFLAGRGFGWDSIAACVSRLAEGGVFEADDDFD